jgi:hypothetical protein
MKTNSKVRDPKHEVMVEIIDLNKAQCLKCNDIIESTHRHDFVSCSCGNLAVDGGKDYIRRLFKDYNLVKELSIYKETKKTIAMNI